MLPPTPNPNPSRNWTEKKNNQNNNNKKDKQQDNLMYDFCKVCKFDHNQGRRHIYFPNHKKSLALFLSRFQSKLSDISFFLKNPLPLRPEHASLNRLWCVFCDCDIIESGSSFACGNAIEHLASVDHLKVVKDFMWRYGGDIKRVDSFRISESDFAKWKKKCLLQKDATFEGAGGSIIGPTNETRGARYYIHKYLELLVMCLVHIMGVGKPARVHQSEMVYQKVLLSNSKLAFLFLEIILHLGFPPMGTQVGIHVKELFLEGPVVRVAHTERLGCRVHKGLLQFRFQHEETAEAMFILEHLPPGSVCLRGTSYLLIKKLEGRWLNPPD